MFKEKEVLDSGEGGGSKKTKIKKAKDGFDSMMNFQLSIFRGALIYIGGLMAKAQYEALVGDATLGSTDFARVGYIIFIIISIFGLFKIEQWNKTKDLFHKASETEANKLADIRAVAVDYIMDTMLPQSTTPEQQFKIMELLPSLLSQVSGNELKKDIANGYSSMTQALALFTQDFKKQLDNIKAEVFKNVVPRTTSKVSDDELLPEGMSLEEDDVLRG